MSDTKFYKYQNINKIIKFINFIITNIITKKCFNTWPDKILTTLKKVFYSKLVTGVFYYLTK